MFMNVYLIMNVRELETFRCSMLNIVNIVNINRSTLPNVKLTLKFLKNYILKRLLDFLEERFSKIDLQTPTNFPIFLVVTDQKRGCTDKKH